MVTRATPTSSDVILLTLTLASGIGGSVLQVQQADSILVVGGGTTGVEMAAELKTAHPHKKVKICILFNSIRKN